MPKSFVRRSPRILINELKIDTFFKRFTYKNVTINYGHLYRGLQRFMDEGKYLSQDRTFSIQKYPSAIIISAKNIEIIWPSFLWESMEMQLNKLPLFPVDESYKNDVSRI